MKLTTTLLALGLSASSTFAGSVQEVATTCDPAPTLGAWFVGGTYGRMDDADNVVADTYGSTIVSPTGFIDVYDLDLESYNLHVGRDLGLKFLGCDLAAYLEVGITDGDARVRGRNADTDPITTLNYDFEIIPVTANLKFERNLFGKLNAYLSAGAGVAFTKITFKSNDTFTSDSDQEDDTEFYMQASAGLLYNITDQWEVYGGARWSNLPDLEFGVGSDEVIDDSIFYEIGVRYNF